jgi:hypothetical protein
MHNRYATTLAVLDIFDDPCRRCGSAAGYSLVGGCLSCGTPALTEHVDIATFVNRHDPATCPNCSDIYQGCCGTPDSDDNFTSIFD